MKIKKDVCCPEILPKITIHGWKMHFWSKNLCLGKQKNIFGDLNDSNFIYNTMQDQWHNTINFDLNY
jgi:hypothetical protein